MILLTSTSDLVQLVTGGTQVVNVQASYVDTSSGTQTPGRLNTSISSATTTTIVGSPASSTQRNVKFLSVTNTDASNSVAVTVKHTDGATPVNLIKLTLQPNNTLTYNDVSGWVLTDANGAAVVTPLAGRFIKSTVLTSSSGTFTTSSQTNTIFIRGVAGGAAGGGTNGTASGAAGGGGAGSYLEKTVAVSPNTGYSYTCGAAGTASASANGGNGGNSTFVVGATTYTCNGGSGGIEGVGSGSLVSSAGGAGGTVSTNGDVNTPGDPGKPGVILIATATGVGVSGNGGSSPFGGGGVGVTAAGSGNAGGGFGAGGSGALILTTTTAKAGSGGSAGCWVVEEYS